MTPPKKPLNVGVMFENVQLSDIIGADVLGYLTPESAQEIINIGGPESVLNDAIPMNFHYISSSLKPAFATPKLKIIPTVTYDDAPRDLDILLIGGPPLRHLPKASLKFLKETARKKNIIMTTCVGALWLASAGVLDGRVATTNRGMLGKAAMMYPNVTWEEKRWVVDGNIWTSGGAATGIDMVVEYAKRNFPSQLLEIGLEGLAFNELRKGQYYEK